MAYLSSSLLFLTGERNIPLNKIERQQKRKEYKWVNQQNIQVIRNEIQSFDKHNK